MPVKIKDRVGNRSASFFESKFNLKGSVCIIVKNLQLIY